MDIFYQGGDGLVQFGQVVLGAGKVFRMPVPHSKGQRHATDTRFNKTAGNQELFPGPHDIVMGTGSAQ